MELGVGLARRFGFALAPERATLPLMGPILATLALIFATLAALIHLGFFFAESVFWMDRRVWRSFGVRTERDAQVLQGMAYNQGFYNAFLALAALTGVALVLASFTRDAGLIVLLVTMLFMVLAGLVLLSTGRGYWRGAALQAIPPLLALAAGAWWWLDYEAFISST